MFGQSQEKTVEAFAPVLDSAKVDRGASSDALAVSRAAARRTRRESSRLRVVVAVCVCFLLWQLFGTQKSVQLIKRPGADESWLSGLILERSGKHSLNASQAEELFLSVPNAERALNTSRKLATHPHLAGASEDLSDAKEIFRLFQHEFRIRSTDASAIPVFPAGTPSSRKATLNIPEQTEPYAWIDEYYPVLNTPLERELQILDVDGKPLWTADLVEDGDELDPEAARYKDSVPTFHGLSADGDVEGQLVYANYGTKEDYDELVDSGVNFTGKIVITRYGDTFRGLKIKGAEERGAAGVLIYSDPRDDGSAIVENGYAPYPAGPARNPTAVQRGSVQYLSMYPGDPTTPGYPAYENATRTEGINIPRIPSLPISWQNAQRLLEEIGGAVEGRLLTGRVSQTTVKLVNHVDTKVTPIWNTMAVIPGHIKDEVVIIGCHRDAWVMGAADPTSGTVSLYELIRGYGELVRSGWRPTRTVVIASWDAEEYGLVGSTEWAEDFADWIQSHVVSYHNLDVSSAGSAFHTSGSPSLAHLIRKTALDLQHPTDSARSLWDAGQDKGPFTGPFDRESPFHRCHSDLSSHLSTGVMPLGSGSDFTVFLQHLGVSSSDQGFGMTPSDAVYHYHSIYDSQRYQELYADPGFHRHVAVGKFLGLLALRVADSVILPLNTTQYSLELDSYLDVVQDIGASSSTPLPDLSRLRAAITSLQAASATLDSEKGAIQSAFTSLATEQRVDVRNHACRIAGGWRAPLKREIDAIAKKIRKINEKLVAFERGFISENGIKDREWYKHLGVAPGKWLGYGATTLPALTEALTIEHNVTLAEIEAHRLSVMIEKLATVLES